MRISIIFIVLFSLSCTTNPNTIIPNKDLGKSERKQESYAREIKIRKLSTFNGDTLSYLTSNFVDNKIRILNKPVGTILRKIELPIISYSLIQEGMPTRDEVNGIYLSFETDATKYVKIKKKQVPNVLAIKFKVLQDSKSVLAVVRKHNLKWNTETAKFFNNSMIKEIQVLKN